MKKYNTPSCELEKVTTSDICALSFELMGAEDEGDANVISWNDTEKWTITPGK